MKPFAFMVVPFDFFQRASFYDCGEPGCEVRVAVNVGHSLHSRLTAARRCPVHMPAPSVEEHDGSDCEWKCEDHHDERVAAVGSNGDE